MPIGYIKEPRMDGAGLLVNDPEHLRMRPITRKLMPGAMNNSNGKAAKETGTDAGYYTSPGCECPECCRYAAGLR